MENIVFLPKNSAVIEIFPYGIYCPLYAKLAATMTLPVRAIHRLSSNVLTRLSIGI